jgi:hypothetical protein
MFPFLAEKEPTQLDLLERATLIHWIPMLINLTLFKPLIRFCVRDKNKKHTIRILNMTMKT